MTPAGAHPAAHELAEFVAGTLEAEHATQVGSHARDCPVCQDIIAQLGHVSRTLSELPRELAVPEHVSARVVAALRAEHATADAAVSPAAEDSSGGDIAWFRRRAPQALAAAASVAVVALAGYVAVSGGDDDQPTAADARAGESAADDSGAGTDGRAAEESPRTFGVGPRPRDSEVDREALSDTVADVWEQRSEFAPGCGQRLGDELGQEIVGSTAVDFGVLVVLEDVDDAQLDGWLVPTCDSVSDEALTGPVVIPAPS